LNYPDGFPPAGEKTRAARIGKDCHCAMRIQRFDGGLEHPRVTGDLQYEIDTSTGNRSDAGQDFRVTTVGRVGAT